jgi:hypothetical protein
MLLIGVAVSVGCLIWIALDAGTEEVFVVYGPLLRTAWQMRVWSVFASCGWRFALIAGVILLNVSLAYQATIGNGIDAGADAVALWCLAVLLAIGLVPWTFLMRIVRYRRSTNATAMMLKETAAHLSTMPDLSSEFERAEYTVESGWDAWHPNLERFQSADGQKLWRRAVPVVYTSAEFPRTVVIPIYWSDFCVWGRPPSFAHSDKLLPFGGPGIARFRVGPNIRRLEVADCWIVRAELELPDETDEDRHRDGGHRSG